MNVLALIQTYLDKIIGSCSDSISGLILNLGCNSPEFAKENLCKYKDQKYEIGEIKKDEPQFVEIFHPKWIGDLTGISLSDKTILKVIKQYQKRGESVDSFCRPVSPLRD